MTNLVFFKGVLHGIEAKKVAKGRTMSRLCIKVDDFVFNVEEMIKKPQEMLYYLTKFEWKEGHKYELDEEYYFVGKVVYKRVESRKAFDKDGKPFTYGTFDFVLSQICKTKQEAKTYIIERLQLN